MLVRRAFQQNRRVKFPSFQNFWKYFQDDDSIHNYVDDNMIDYRDCIGTGRDLCGLIKEAIRANAYYDEEDDYVDYDRLYDDYWEEYAYDIILQNVVKPIMRKKYDKIVQKLHALNGKPCWRAIRVKDNPTQIDNLGIYWAYDRRGAEAYQEAPEKKRAPKKRTRGNQQYVMYKGIIDLRYVSIEETIAAQLNYQYGEYEYEIRFYDGAPIFIESVKIFGDDIRTIKINDWRWC